ncbi:MULTISPECIES: GntR family transcriptional regulator [unclassified Ensifer]|uniref:GntR family transcriptional regulator n=1 Tax=unclassified Ensifer TaxID=2633371 RepID=UPI00070DEEEE|nr:MULTISPECIES: GntR family transcriptional regulator [unclassified Ensifer]KQU82231.1 transcriptional regulator [Ensifer sp. Root31]KQY66246.1 transcriptional regulator [Ensifer sp. Root142]MBD9487122.1 GntR family transcriptional regulator [Ensifer sp. ENS11]PSS59700.1 GntR family transcriptional regulator [Ensifer sp. NM-2]
MSMTEMQDVTETAAKERDVTDLVLEDILTGVLPAGTWLKQIDLEKRYDCTRPEVRRALDRLSQKRLVEHVPNRGYHVYQPDGRRAQEVSDIRVILETAVADLMVERATPESIARLRQLASHFDQMTMVGTVLEHYEANLAFHRELLLLSGNHELVDLVSEIRQRTSSAPVSQWRTRARVERSAREHHMMVDALETRDVAGLKRLIEAHIRQTGDVAPAESVARQA